MDTTIPYHAGLLLGRSVNMKTVTPGFMLVGEDIPATQLRVSLSTSQFSFVRTLRDLCEILNIPPEYALKVKARQLNNQVVEACLRDLEKPHTLILVFRCTFLELLQNLSTDVVPVGSDVLSDVMTSRKEERSTESLIAEATTDLCLASLSSRAEGSRADRWTHWVKTVEIGNELITVLTITCKDEKFDKLREKFDKLREKLEVCLGSSYGQLDTQKVSALLKVATDIDKKLSKRDYKDVSAEIQYCSFDDLEKYPCSISGMVKVIDSFMDQCAGWTERGKHEKEVEVEACTMKCVVGRDKEEKTTVLGNVVHAVSNHRSSPPVGSCQFTQESAGQIMDTDVDNDSESYVVLDTCGSHYFYSLRVKLQSFKEAVDVGDSLSSLALYSGNTYTMFENLIKLLGKSDKAQDLIQEFLRNRFFFMENRTEEARCVLKSVQEAYLFVQDIVRGLDFVSIPDESTVANINTTDPLLTVETFIENVTSRLPPGSDIDLLMIGKTGHGKSSTGNSILGHDKFVASSDSESVTSSSGVGWAQVDDRVIKVVDTPGVCDTNVENDMSSINMAIKSISEAIANCPAGFHALLLIIRFGIRMTKEEKKAIGMLKCILGEDIVRSHCICVITHGDNFDNEFRKKKTTFEDWCRTRQGFLKELFEECGYRCVLFNNITTDPKVKKTQLIQLVATVDTLKKSGTRYTNSLFEFAQKERQRIISEENVPQVNEEMVRDIQLILEHLNTMVHNTNEASQYRDELSRLRERVDNLRNRVSETGQLQCLVETIFSLAATIHSKIDEIADRTSPDWPDKSQGAVGGTQTKKMEIQVYRRDFLVHKDELQKFYDDEVSPKQSMVTERVTEQVKSEVEKDNSCFPASATVVLETGKVVRMEELQVGDQVLARDAKGQLTYDTVYVFGHREFGVSSRFLAMKTAMQTVHVTSEHYVYCVQQGNEMCVAAKNVRVGDCLLVATSQGLQPHAVEAITLEQQSGRFAPFTNSGTILVDGALMSCYIDVLPPGACHTLLWPLRQLYKVSPRGLSFLNGSTAVNPVPRWARAAMKLM